MNSRTYQPAKCELSSVRVALDTNFIVYESSWVRLILVPTVIIPTVIRVATGVRNPRHRYCQPSSATQTLTATHSQLTATPVVPPWLSHGHPLKNSRQKLCSTISLQSIQAPLTPFIARATAKFLTHAAVIVWVNNPAFNPPCHNSTLVAWQTEFDPVLTRVINVVIKRHVCC